MRGLVSNLCALTGAAILLFGVYSLLGIAAALILAGLGLLGLAWLLG